MPTEQALEVFDKAQAEGTQALSILDDIRDRTGGWFHCECGDCVIEGDDFHAWEAFERHVMDAAHFACSYLAEVAESKVAEQAQTIETLKADRDNVLIGGIPVSVFLATLKVEAEKQHARAETAEASLRSAQQEIEHLRDLIGFQGGDPIDADDAYTPEQMRELQQEFDAFVADRAERDRKVAHYDEMRAHLTAAQQAQAGLRKLLIRYGRHDAQCCAPGSAQYDGCICGFSAALASQDHP